MALLERDREAPPAWRGNLPVTNRYTFGLAGERFFRAIKEEGRIMGSICHHCVITYVPAAAFCERCLNPIDDWVDAGASGEVHSFTILYVNYDGSPRETPELIGFIRLGDGGLVHRISEISVEEISIGMPVEAVFKPASERIGSIVDIKYFRPTGKASKNSVA